MVSLFELPKQAAIMDPCYGTGSFLDALLADAYSNVIDVWNGRIEAPSKFCVESTVQPNDEWLHSFYYFRNCSVCFI